MKTPKVQGTPKRQRKLIEVPPELHADLALLAKGRRTKLKFVVMEAVAAYARVYESELRRYRQTSSLSQPPQSRTNKGRYQ